MKHAIVDSHIHFWDPQRLQYDWLSSAPAINRPFLPADLEQHAAGLNLEQIVFVQADCRPEQGLQEAAWITELARDQPWISGIVAYAPLEQGEAVRPYLDELAAYPLVKGVRRLIQSEAAGFCLQPGFIHGVRLLAEFGFSFDICILHHQLVDVISLVQRCPEVSFALDHLGKPAIKEQRLDPWRGQIESLAACPKVCGKLSGAVTEADLAQWTPADLQPYLDHCLTAFGLDRVLYGGDWPVSLLAASYRRWIETLDAATVHLSAADKNKLFSANARRFYRLELPGQFL